MGNQNSRRKYSVQLQSEVERLDESTLESLQENIPCDTRGQIRQLLKVLEEKGEVVEGLQRGLVNVLDDNDKLLQQLKELQNRNASLEEKGQQLQELQDKNAHLKEEGLQQLRELEEANARLREQRNSQADIIKNEQTKINILRMSGRQNSFSCKSMSQKNESLQKKLKEAENRIERMQRNNNTLHSSVDELKLEKERLREELRCMEHGKAELEGSCKEMEEALERSEEKNRALHEQQRAIDFLREEEAHNTHVITELKANCKKMEEALEESERKIAQLEERLRQSQSQASHSTSTNFGI